MEFEDTDDFIIDDLLSKKKKKKVDGKKKGNRVELSLTKIFNSRFGSGFSRSVGSGNRYSQVNLSHEAMQLYSGDLTVPNNFLFVLEAKGGYSIDLSSIFIKGNSDLDKFLKQVTVDSERCGRKPMLCWKKDNRPWLAFVLSKELIGYEFEYSLKYKEWTGIALEELLKLNNKFFISS